MKILRTSIQRTTGSALQAAPIGAWIGLLLIAVCAQAESKEGSRASQVDPVIERLLAVQTVSAMALSPDGAQAVYVLTTNDSATDKRRSDLWIVDVDSGESRQLTYSAEGESSPQWRPDGLAIGFLSDRHDPEEGTDQVWLLPLRGGEATRITDSEGGVEDFVFSVAGGQLAIVALQPDPFEAPGEDEKIRTAPPIVLDRMAFKADREGYLTRHRELYLVDIESGDTTRLAANVPDPLLPSFSPDGEALAFVSKGGEDPDRTDNYDVYIVALEADAEAEPVVVTAVAECSPDYEERPTWSSDGRYIACIALEYDRDGYYAQSDLALIDTRSGTVRHLTTDLDLNIGNPRFSADGHWIWVTVEEDMSEQLARVRIEDGSIERVLSGDFSVRNFEVEGGRIVARIGSTSQPWALYAVDDGKRRRLTRHNDELLAAHPWQEGEEIAFQSADGTEVHGLLLRPVGAQPGRRYPTVLWIHGGPVSQFAHSPRLEPQLFAALGYAVVMVNPRGSSGRGEAYSKAIFAAWGSVDVPDVLAGIDHAVEIGVADAERLVVGGWSYGGMLTNYVIASDGRFKAAASGASIGNAWAGFGTDMYIREYLSELGRPWEEPEAYDRVSYPFLHADRIVTPTIFLVGEKDYNVPLLASEQMYQALQVLGVPSRLVIYPGQGHSIAVPSYKADVWRRYLDWFAENLAD